MTADRAVPMGANRFRFLGRVDNVIKVAGKRVDLDEVKEKIKRIPGVTDAYLAVVPLEKARRAEISALVVSDLPLRKLKTAIRSLDEPYGRPRRIRIVPSIPVLPNGKIDRQEVDRLLASFTLPETFA